MANPANDFYLLLILLTIIGLVFWLIWLLTTQHRSETAILQETVLQTQTIIDQNNAIIEQDYLLNRRLSEQLDDLARLYQEQHRRGRPSSRVVEATTHVSTDLASSERSADPTKPKTTVAIVPSFPVSSS